MANFSVRGTGDSRQYTNLDAVNKEKKIRTDNKVDAQLSPAEFVEDLEGAVDKSKDSHIEIGQYKEKSFEYIKVSRAEAKSLLKGYKEKAKKGFVLADIDFNLGKQSLTLKTAPKTTGNILTRSVTINGSEVDFYKKPSLKHGVENPISVEKAIEDVNQTIDQMSSTGDLKRMRHHAAVDLYFERHSKDYSSRSSFGPEAYAKGALKTKLLAIADKQGVIVKDRARPRFGEFKTSQVNLALTHTYNDHLKETQKDLSELTSESAPDVKLVVAKQTTFDRKVFHPKTNLTLLESGATGPAKGVNKFLGAITEGYAQLADAESNVDYGTVTSESEFIKQSQETWANCPPDQHACLMVSGHSGTPKSGNIDDGAFKGIHLNNRSNSSASVLGPGTEDYPEWRKITKGAKAGDMIVINSCDGASTKEQQVAYAQLVQETFPEGVHLIISNGKAQADATCVNGYIVMTKK